jgi:hypothetical protein
MAGTPPNYDNVQWPGGDGIRVPTEVFGSKGPATPGGTLALVKQVKHDFGAAAVAWNLNPAETQASHYIVSNASGAANVVFPGAFPGKRFSVFNTSGATITFLVTGQTGVAVATAKRAILVCEDTDIARVTADT